MYAAFDSAAIMLPTGPPNAPAIGNTQKVLFGKAPQASRMENPAELSRRVAQDVPSSTHSEQATSTGATICPALVSRQAEKSPMRMEVATSWARR